MSPAPSGGDDWPDITALYDTLAADYAERFVDELDHKPADRALLDRFAAALAPAAAPGAAPRPAPKVADLGCGPGHVGAYLAARGCAVTGIDLSPAMVAEAARRYPALTFRRGDLRDLPLPDGGLSGAVAFYSLIHLRRPEVPGALSELARVLAPGGHALLAVHGGQGELRKDRFLDHPLDVAATLFELDELAGLAAGAGLDEVERHRRPPYPDEADTPRLYLWLRRPGGPGPAPR